MSIGIFSLFLYYTCIFLCSFRNLFFFLVCSSPALFSMWIKSELKQLVITAGLLNISLTQIVKCALFCFSLFYGNKHTFDDPAKPNHLETKRKLDEALELNHKDWCVVRKMLRTDWVETQAEQTELRICKMFSVMK